MARENFPGNFSRGPEPAVLPSFRRQGILLTEPFGQPQFDINHVAADGKIKRMRAPGHFGTQVLCQTLQLAMGKVLRLPAPGSVELKGPRGPGVHTVRIRTARRLRSQPVRERDFSPANRGNTSPLFELVIRAEADNDVMLLLENTAGEKNSVGSSFEHIGAILDGLPFPGQVGVCLDTCHAFAPGYELRTGGGLDDTVAQFDDQVGLGRLRVIHLNDTKGDRGSGLDRHEHIGMGFIGEDGFRRILHHKAFLTLPLVCETPVDDRRDDRGNIEKVRELAGT